MRQIILQILIHFGYSSCPWVFFLMKISLYIASSDPELTGECIIFCSKQEDACMAYCSGDLECILYCQSQSANCKYSCPCFDGCPAGCQGRILNQPFFQHETILYLIIHNRVWNRLLLVPGLWIKRWLHGMWRAFPVPVFSLHWKVPT